MIFSPPKLGGARGGLNSLRQRDGSDLPWPLLTQEGKELPHLDTHLREIVGGFGIADKLLNGTVDGL